MVRTRYLMWYDDNPKIPLVNKVEAAIAAYTRRFRRDPNVVLMNEATPPPEQEVIQIRGVPFVQPNNFWVGIEDQER